MVPNQKSVSIQRDNKQYKQIANLTIKYIAKCYRWYVCLFIEDTKRALMDSGLKDWKRIFFLHKSFSKK